MILGCYSDAERTPLYRRAFGGNNTFRCEMGGRERGKRGREGEEVVEETRAGEGEEMGGRVGVLTWGLDKRRREEKKRER